MEGSPSDDQKRRLEDWLSELMLICRRYQVVPCLNDGDTVVVDLVSGTVIGLGLVPLVNDSEKVTAMDCDGSILDGTWLVDGESGPVEQRAVGPVWQRREINELD